MTRYSTIPFAGLLLLCACAAEPGSGERTTSPRTQSGGAYGYPPGLEPPNSQAHRRP